MISFKTDENNICFKIAEVKIIKKPPDFSEGLYL
ncbi:hypothetical protein SAMN05444408_112104 [Chryseobacterium takakiae]|uniref:Uncharacterized protein n=1 Tax=Chryseobacterium takakiae TaxID=1302685 RepID=A0A1M5AB12_9FLAO|nr:hypothetical protein SAMN05444408_112104 [Chryseobacterium takakiae]